MPVMPKMEVVMRFESNVQSCDVRLMVVCLVKQTASKENHKVPTFLSSALSGEVTGDRGTGAAANEK